MVLTESHEVVFSGHPSREDLTGDGGSASKLTHTVVGRRLHFLCKGVSLFGCSRLRLAVNSVNVGRQTERERERRRVRKGVGEIEEGITDFYDLHLRVTHHLSYLLNSERERSRLVVSVSLRPHGL